MWLLHRRGNARPPLFRERRSAGATEVRATQGAVLEGAAGENLRRRRSRPAEGQPRLPERSAERPPSQIGLHPSLSLPAPRERRRMRASRRPAGFEKPLCALPPKAPPVVAHARWRQKPGLVAKPKAWLKSGLVARVCRNWVQMSSSVSWRRSPVVTPRPAITRSSTSVCADRARMAALTLGSLMPRWIWLSKGSPALAT